MRIIAGSARGRKLVAPPGRDTRPILDSLKEALFNIIQERVPGAVVWDLFSGPGSMGLEALSRGAEQAVFVDRGRAALTALKKNIEALGWGDRCRVSSADALRFGRRADDPAPDLIFFDPPFPMVEKDPEAMSRRLTLLGAELAPHGLLVYRSPATSALTSDPEGLVLDDRRVKGVNALHFLRMETFSN